LQEGDTVLKTERPTRFLRMPTNWIGEMTGLFVSVSKTLSGFTCE